MQTIFVDASFYIALLFSRDRLHSLAVELAVQFDERSDVRFITTQAVLLEVLAFLADEGLESRDRAANLTTRLKRSPVTTVLEVTNDLFERGLQLYRDRPDKAYSLCDCTSMVVCTELGITDVLTHDHDFEQERFTILL